MQGRLCNLRANKVTPLLQPSKVVDGYPQPSKVVGPTTFEGWLQKRGPKQKGKIRLEMVRWFAFHPGIYNMMIGNWPWTGCTYVERMTAMQKNGGGRVIRTWNFVILRNTVYLYATMFMRYHRRGSGNIS